MLTCERNFHVMLSRDQVEHAVLQHALIIMTFTNCMENDSAAFQVLYSENHGQAMS